MVYPLTPNGCVTGGRQDDFMREAVVVVGVRILDLAPYDLGKLREDNQIDGMATQVGYDAAREARHVAWVGLAAVALTRAGSRSQSATSS
jgi:hypothetical protein